MILRRLAAATTKKVESSTVRASGAFKGVSENDAKCEKNACSTLVKIGNYKQKRKFWMSTCTKRAVELHHILENCQMPSRLIRPHAAETLTLPWVEADGESGIVFATIPW